MKIKKFNGLINVVPDEKYFTDEGEFKLSKEEAATLRDKPHLNFKVKEDKNGNEYWSGKIKISYKVENDEWKNTNTIHVKLNTNKELNRLLTYTLSSTPVTITAIENEVDGNKFLNFTAVEDNRNIKEIAKSFNLEHLTPEELKAERRQIVAEAQNVDEAVQKDDLELKTEEVQKKKIFKKCR